MKPRKSELIEKRVLEEAQWYLDTKSSVRSVAKHFGVSKTTVHQDLTKRLRHIDYCMWKCVMNLIHYNTTHVVEKMNAVNFQTNWAQNRSRRRDEV